MYDQTTLNELVWVGEHKIQQKEAERQAEIDAREAEEVALHTRQWGEFRDAIRQMLPEVLHQYLRFATHEESGARIWLDGDGEAQLEIEGFANIVIRAYHWPDAKEEREHVWHLRPKDSSRLPFLVPTINREAYWNYNIQRYRPEWKSWSWQSGFSELTLALAVAKRRQAEFDKLMNEYDELEAKWEAEELERVSQLEAAGPVDPVDRLVISREEKNLVVALRNYFIREYERITE